MPERKYRSRSYKRVSVKTPGGKTSVHYRRGKVSHRRCAICGSIIHGLKRLRPSELAKLSKTKKTVSRAYGGYLCHNCLSNMIRRAVRSLYE